MVNSVIMIAYFFPPEGCAGAYRPLRFVRHLAQRGWRATVISADRLRHNRYDPSLLTLVPDDTKIIRAPERDPWQALQAWRGRRMQEKRATASVATVERINARQHTPLRARMRKIVQTAEAWYYHPDREMAWIQPAVEAVVTECERNRPQVIWATASPISAWVVAQRASQRTGVPYVLDLRDPYWLGCYDTERQQPAWAQRLHRQTMYRLFAGAQATVFLFATSAECYWRAYAGALGATKIHLIPNGYEGEIAEFSAARGEQCLVLYTGTLSTYDYAPLLHALRRFVMSDPSQARLLRFLFVGEGMEGLAKQAAALELSDIVQVAGPSPQVEIARLQHEAHALLIFGRPREEQGHELLAGAKLFHYLKSGRPIVGILPHDETRKVLAGVGVSTIADADSPTEIIAVLRQVLAAWSAGTLSSLVPDHTACAAYSAERQTSALVQALAGAPAVHPFTPGAVEIPPSLRDELGDSDWRRARQAAVAAQTS